MSVPIRITNQDTVATVVTDSQTAAAGAMSKTIPAGTAAVRSYLCSVVITGLGATSAAGIDATITGAGSGTITLKVPVPAGATVAMPSQSWYFDPPLPATSLAAAITVAVPSFGTGNTAAGLVIKGYQA